MIFNVRLIDLLGDKTDFDQSKKTNIQYVVSHISSTLTQIKSQQSYVEEYEKEELIKTAEKITQDFIKKWKSKSGKKSWNNFLTTQKVWLEKTVYQFEIENVRNTNVPPVSIEQLTFNNLCVGPVNWDGIEWKEKSDLSDQTSYQELIMEELINLTDSKICDDTCLICYDGEMTAPRVLLALAYPSLLCVLRMSNDEDMTLFMPEFRCVEVQGRIWACLTQQLENQDHGEQISYSEAALSDNTYSDSEDKDEGENDDYIIDDDYTPEDVESNSDTEILGEPEELEKELMDLNTVSCTCCTDCRNNRVMVEQKVKPFSHLRSKRQKIRRLNRRLLNLDGSEEALSLIRRLQRDYPEHKGDCVTNLSLLTLIKNLRLSYNQVFFLECRFHYKVN